MRSSIDLSITVIVAFQRFQRHVHTYRILPDLDGLLAVQVSVPQTPHTPHWEGKQGKYERCEQTSAQTATPQLRPDVISAVRLRACGAGSAAQRRNCFYAWRIPGQPTHWVITHGEGSFVAACVYTRLFVLDIMSPLDVAVWSSSVVCKSTHQTRGSRPRRPARHSARKQESQTSRLGRPKLQLMFLLYVCMLNIEKSLQWWWAGDHFQALEKSSVLTQLGPATQLLLQLFFHQL